jgi:hypothetical protein
MSVIYRGAQRVIIWLGAANRTIDDFMRRGKNRVAGARDLAHRPYWRRLWVIPEIKLARATRVYCGQWYTRLDTVFDMLVYEDIVHGDCEVSAGLC